MKALLYSDDVVSQKYHNNGNLDFVTSFSLSVVSNIITSIVIWIIKKFINYHKLLQLMVKDIQNEKSFLQLFKKVYKWLKIIVEINNNNNKKENFKINNFKNYYNSNKNHNIDDVSFEKILFENDNNSNLNNNNYNFNNNNFNNDENPIIYKKLCEKIMKNYKLKNLNELKDFINKLIQRTNNNDIFLEGIKKILLTENKYDNKY